MSVTTPTCPRCGSVQVEAARYCAVCGYPLVAGATPAAPPMPIPRITSTHTGGFLILALLISLLWFRVNGAAVLPVGLLGGLIVAWWSSDIDRQAGKPSQFSIGAILAIVGAFIGFIV